MTLRWLALLSCLLTFGCGRDPEGVYEGEITDWVKLVYEGQIQQNGRSVSIELILTQGQQADAGGPVVLSTSNGATNKRWEGTWSVDSDKRRILLGDRVYYLTKRARLHEFQAKDSSHEDELGTPFNLIMNKGLSRRHGLLVSFTFKVDGVVVRQAGENSQSGAWESMGDEIVAKFEDENERLVERFHFSWDNDDLLLRKISALHRGKVNEAFGMPSQKSRMPRKVYGSDHKPRFRHRGTTRRD